MNTDNIVVEYNYNSAQDIASIMVCILINVRNVPEYYLNKYGIINCEPSADLKKKNKADCSV